MFVNFAKPTFKQQLLLQGTIYSSFKPLIRHSKADSSKIVPTESPRNFLLLSTWEV